MWRIFFNTLKLLLKGKLFREPREVMKKWLLGFALAALAMIVLAMLGVPLWLTVVIVAVGVGALQPYLFRHLKYY